MQNPAVPKDEKLSIIFGDQTGELALKSLGLGVSEYSSSMFGGNISKAKMYYCMKAQYESNEAETALTGIYTFMLLKRVPLGRVGKFLEGGSIRRAARDGTIALAAMHGMIEKRCRLKATSQMNDGANLFPDLISGNLEGFYLEKYRLEKIPRSQIQSCNGLEIEKIHSYLPTLLQCIQSITGILNPIPF